MLGLIGFKKREVPSHLWQDSLFLALGPFDRSAEALLPSLRNLLQEERRAHTLAKEVSRASRGSVGGLWWTSLGKGGFLLIGWRALQVGENRGITLRTVYRLSLLPEKEARGFPLPNPEGSVSHLLGVPPSLEDWAAPKEVLKALLPPADPLLPPPEEGGYEKAQEVHEVREALTFLLGREGASEVRRLHALPGGVVLALAQVKPASLLPFPEGQYRVVGAFRQGRVFAPGIQGPLYREEPFSGGLEALAEEVPYELVGEPGEEHHRTRAQKRLLRFLERYPLGGV